MKQWILLHIDKTVAEPRFVSVVGLRNESQKKMVHCLSKPVRILSIISEEKQKERSNSSYEVQNHTGFDIKPYLAEIFNSCCRVAVTAEACRSLTCCVASRPDESRRADKRVNLTTPSFLLILTRDRDAAHDENRWLLQTSAEWMTTRQIQ